MFLLVRVPPWILCSFPTRRSSDLHFSSVGLSSLPDAIRFGRCPPTPVFATSRDIVTVNGEPLRKSRMPWSCQPPRRRSEEHTSELQSHSDIVCRLLLEKKKISSVV